MEKPKGTIKKGKTKKMKPELIIVEEVSPKNKTLKSSSSSKGKRCKNGTKKYKPLGPGCYTEIEIENFKLTKVKSVKNPKKQAKTKKVIELEIVEDKPVEIIKEEKIIEPEITKIKNVKRSLKTPIELEIMEELPQNKQKRYNEEFIELMEKLNNIMLKQGEPFRARAYQKAQETIMAFPDDITNPNQLKGKPGIGSTIMDKLNEYVQTGTLRVLEREKTNPINILGDIYGVGPKKAQELVNVGIKTIDELREKQNELLNDIQKVGLRYYEQIQERIPRSEIEEYEKIFREKFAKVSKGESSDDKFEIVGS
jgi:Fingers domain of DNA polymerase lambda/Helix-hairpin-helix domain